MPQINKAGSFSAAPKPSGDTPGPSPTPPAPWSVTDAAELYRIHQWGQGYFSVNDAGHVTVHPTQDPAVAIDLKKLVDELTQRDLPTPLLIRFTDILRHRLGALARAFNDAIDRFGYQGNYAAVYPIKVNQQRHVVQEILRFGQEYGFGLEAGSKPELLAVMALVQDNSTPIICNGFKDESFVEAVILAGKIGRNIIPVVEKFSELKLLVRFAQQHQVRPRIGIRMKLTSRGAGRWEQSGGLRSKFGLFLSEVIEAVDFLRSQDMLDCLKLLHCHLGSQVNDIASIKSAINELARVYAQLLGQGAALEYLDVGGGLAVDYDGSHTADASSANYSLQEYANNVVFHIHEVCSDAKVPHPTILSESGRAMVAYYSVMVFNVLGQSGVESFEVPDDLNTKQIRALPKAVQTLYESYHQLNESNFAEYFHDSQLNRDEMLNLFNLGYCTLQDRGLGERLFFGICAKVMQFVRKMPTVPEEFAGLGQMLADTYFCNWSIFQSLPDHWAVGQLFPIMPIHRLKQEPTRRGILADITCDSDGTINKFISRGDAAKPVLELHRFTGSEYYLGTFLVGAYQEILGDMHNLFGLTNAVHVALDKQGNPVIEEVVEGDSIAQVLSYVQFKPHELRRTLRRTIETAIHDKKLTLSEAQVMRRFYEQGLGGYTYLT